LAADVLPELFAGALLAERGSGGGVHAALVSGAREVVLVVFARHVAHFARALLTFPYLVLVLARFAFRAMSFQKLPGLARVASHWAVDAWSGIERKTKG
jgi:hypothetical protein